MIQYLIILEQLIASIEFAFCSYLWELITWSNAVSKQVKEAIISIRQKKIIREIAETLAAKSPIRALKTTNAGLVLETLKSCILKTTIVTYSLLNSEKENSAMCPFKGICIRSFFGH